MSAEKEIYKMTALIERELHEVFMMFYCGLSVMLLFTAGEKVIERCGGRRILCGILYLGMWICASFLFSEFLYSASRGIVSLHGLAAMGVGILLWKKVICGILLPSKREKTDKKK